MEFSEGNLSTAVTSTNNILRDNKIIDNRLHSEIKKNINIDKSIESLNRWVHSNDMAVVRTETLKNNWLIIRIIVEQYILLNNKQ